MKGIDQYTETNINNIRTLLENNKSKKYLQGFVNHLRLTKSETTTYNYVRHIIDFMDSIDNKALNEIKYDDYISYESKFLSYSSSYKIVKHSALKAFSEYLFITKKNKTNYMENVKAPKASQSVETIEKRENNYLDYDQVHRLFNQVEHGIGSHRARKRQKDWETRDMAIIVTLVNTGMRCSALYKLDVSDINFETHEIMVKEKGKVQMYYLNDLVIDAIQKWLVDREKLLDGVEEDALFISNQKQRMCIKAISNITQKYGRYIKEGVNLTPHKLRATFGTQVYAATGDLYLTQQAMGHSNANTTAIYIRGQKKASKIKAAEAMSQFCAG